MNNLFDGKVTIGIEGGQIKFLIPIPERARLLELLQHPKSVRVAIDLKIHLSDEVIKALLLYQAQNS